MGRPTKYTDDMPQKLMEFFDIKPYYTVKVEITKANGDTERKEIERPTDMPFLVDFATKVGVAESTIVRWATKRDPQTEKLVYPEFCNAYKKAKKLQEKLLVTNALRGNYNSTAFIFTAKNMLGWRDKQEIEHEVKRPKPILSHVLNHDGTPKDSAPQKAHQGDSGRDERG